MLGILWAHVMILGGLLYVIAYGISGSLFRVLPHRYASIVMFGLIAALFVASTFEIYRLPGHHSAPPANILRIISEFATYLQAEAECSPGMIHEHPQRSVSVSLFLPV